MAEAEPTMLPADTAAALCAAGVSVAYLFGSRARGEARQDSDADVAVLLRDPAATVSVLDEAALAATFADALGVETVDLTLVDQAPLELRARVVREGRLLLGRDEPRRVRFEVDTQSRWFDVSPAHAAQTAAFLRRVAAEGVRG